MLVVAGSVHGMFEFGRYSAGFDALTALQERARLRAEIAANEATISELRAKVAQLESSTVGQTREREEVQRTIGELQAQVARANQELAFFRGSPKRYCRDWLKRGLKEWPQERRAVRTRPRLGRVVPHTA